MGQTLEDLHERGLVEVGSPRSGSNITSSPHAYFEHVQNKRSLFVANNKRGKVVVGTPLSYKLRGSIAVRSLWL